MAHSRLEKIGTIFSRISGLLKSGALKTDDKPLWYEVYAAFPPKLEPKFDRPAPNIPIRQIFYKEDLIRANYQKSTKFQETINLSDTKYQTNCQQFIEIYDNLKEQGPLDEERIIETAKEILQERIKTRVTSSKQEPDPMMYSDLVRKFTEAKNNQTDPVNIKDIFKD